MEVAKIKFFYAYQLICQLHMSCKEAIQWKALFHWPKKRDRKFTFYNFNEDFNVIKTLKKNNISPTQYLIYREFGLSKQNILNLIKKEIFPIKIDREDLKLCKKRKLTLDNIVLANKNKFSIKQFIASKIMGIEIGKYNMDMDS